MSAFDFYVVEAVPSVGNINSAFIQHLDVFIENMCATPEDLHTWLSQYVTVKQRIELENLHESVAALREALLDHASTKVGDIDIGGNFAHS